MLDTARVGSGGASYNGPAGNPIWRPVVLAEIPPDHAKALSAAYRGRAPLTVALAGRSVELSAAWRPNSAGIADPCAIALSLGGEPAELILPRALIGLFLKDLDPALSFDALTPEHRALILEYALSGALEAFEAAHHIPISLLSVEAGSGQRGPSGHAALAMTAELEVTGRHGCLLRLSPAKLMDLAGLLDRHAGEAPSAIDPPIAVHIRWGSVDLSLAELESLSPGDIVLADFHCPEAETAFAAFGDHLAAPVRILPEGCGLLDRPKPMHGSAAAWSSSRLPLANGAMRDAAPKDTPMRVFFELAQFDMPLGALHGLAAGATIGAGHGVGGYLHVVVEGTRIARGELTSIGAGFGVRIVKA